jgi:hypothetical protein
VLADTQGFGVSLKKKPQCFAKIRAYNEEAELSWAERDVQNMRLQKYCQSTTNKRLQFSYIITWPFIQPPKDVLGRNLEALDPLRQKFKTYIEQLPGPQLAIQLASNHEKKLEEVVQRMYGLIEQIRATYFQCDGQLFFLGTSGLSTSARIIYQVYENLDERMPQKQLVVPRLSLPAAEMKTVKLEHGLNQERTQQLHARLRECFETLRWSTGAIKARISLGVCVLDRYKQPRPEGFDIEQWEELADDSRGVIKTIPAFLDVDYPIVERFQGASAHLSPADAILTDIKDTQPIYTATFELCDSESRWYELDASFRLNQVGEAVGPSLIWSRLFRGESKPRQVLDVSIADIEE